MSVPAWISRILAVLDLGLAHEIFFLVGSAELARPALWQLEAQLERFGGTRWHRLHTEGFAGLVDGPDTGKIHLVHGFERMDLGAAMNMAARLNLNRDSLHNLGAPIVFWIASDFYDHFRSQAPDLVDWRSDFMILDDEVIDCSHDQRYAEILLLHAWHKRADLIDLPELDVLAPDGSRQPIGAWMERHPALGLADDSAGASASIVVLNQARQLARRHEAGETEHVPALVPFAVSGVRRTLSIFHNQLSRGAPRSIPMTGLTHLWERGKVWVFSRYPTEFEAWLRLTREGEWRPGNKLLSATARTDSSLALPLAPLTDEQQRQIIDNFNQRMHAQHGRGLSAHTVRTILTEHESVFRGVDSLLTILCAVDQAGPATIEELIDSSTFVSWCHAQLREQAERRRWRGELPAND